MVTEVTWYIHTVRERDRDRYRDQMESIVLCRNIHTGQDRDRHQDPLFPIVPTSFPVSVPFPFPSSVNKPTLRFMLKAMCMQSFDHPV